MLWTRHIHRQRTCICSAQQQPYTRQTRFIPEQDPRYQRADFGYKHAWEAQQAFAAIMARGEAQRNIALAALHVAAEDDALVSHSAVRLPVQSYLQRMTRMANDISAHVLPGLHTAEDILEGISTYLYSTQGFSTAPADQRPDGRWAYLHRVLTTRQGTPAALAIMHAHIVQLLLEQHAIDFAVRVAFFDVTGTVPCALALPGLTRNDLLRPDGTVANTCTSDALVALLRYLKHTYWPLGLAGTGSKAGIAFDDDARKFTTAVDTLLQGSSAAIDAESQALAYAASYRLERGIFAASELAGDVRRSVAACRRLVALDVAGERPMERLHLAVLLAHQGRWAHALVEIQAYLGGLEGELSQQPFWGTDAVKETNMVSSMDGDEQAHIMGRVQALQGVALVNVDPQKPLPAPTSMASLMATPAPVAAEGGAALPLEW